MIDIAAAEAWAEALGLAPAPLFGADDGGVAGNHAVLLDGGSGSIAISSCDDEIWREATPAGWAWSSDIPHHLTITNAKVAVTRWDMPRQSTVYDRSSVERGFERFYAFLIDDRLRSNKTVVQHLLNLFRRLRSLSHASGLADSRATDVFGAILAEMIAPEEAKGHPENFGLKPDAFELTAQLDPWGVAATLEEFGCATGSLAALKLYPSLAVRHAAGQLFQEAHFELLRAPTSADLFGLIGPPEIAAVTRGGTHFTPPPLARTVVEQAIDAGPDLLNQAELTICDPACGSGAFLHESLRALRRSGYGGLIRLIGQDQSAAAVSMAEFVLRTSLRDWSPAGGVELTLKTGDSLGELGIPDADVILMNPPFISFGSQSQAQREQLREAVGSAGAARGDYSMAFVTQALESLRPGGVLGTLFPASLLSLKAAAEWREMLLDAGEIRFLGSIGEFGLFAHAMVQVACAVMRKKGAQPLPEFTALVTQNDPAATSEALRWLRKTTRKAVPQPITETGWALFPVSSESLNGRATWRLISPESDRALRSILDMQLPTIGEIFHVYQGVQTGLNAALLLTESQWSELPKRERRYFRRATMTDSIQNGRVVTEYFVFYPHEGQSALFTTEQEVQSAIPTFYAKFIAPNAQRLKDRAFLKQSSRTDWWGLMSPRSWSAGATPKIISKFFGAEGAFLCDVDGSHLPVMGHAWVLKQRAHSDAEDEVPLSHLLFAYSALLNSEPFARLLAIYSPHVAGGQFDLSTSPRKPDSDAKPA